VAIVQSGLHFLALSGVTSGFGFAIAKMIGFSLRFMQTSSVNTSLLETPIKTSAPFEISAKVVSSVIV